MDVQKLIIEITEDKVTVSIDDEVIGGLQELNLKLDSEGASTAVADIKLWKKIGDTSPLKKADLLEQYESAFGIYVTPYTNQVELVEEEVVFIPEA